MVDFFSTLGLILGGGLIGVGGYAGVVLYLKRQKRAKKAKQPKPTQEEVPREKVPNKIEFEIVREKDARTIIVKKGKISKALELKNWKRRSYYPNHIIKETLGKKVRYFARFNLYYSEALDAAHPKVPEYDSSLESQLMNDMENQLGKAVGAAVGFVLERPIIMLLLLAMVFGIPIGLSYNDIFNWVPKTVVHWVPRA